MEQSLLVKHHIENLEHLGFWEDLTEDVVIYAIEKCLPRETLQVHYIKSIEKIEGKFLINWMPRFMPLTDEELLEKYGL